MEVTLRDVARPDSGAGRRTAMDEKWMQTKREVFKRDGGRCRFEDCLTAAEAYSLVPGVCETLDPAHVISVSDDVTQTYNPKNVITLRRFIHRRMDAYQNPLNGRSITANEHYWWWWRIITRRTDVYDELTDYKSLVLGLIGII